MTTLKGIETAPRNRYILLFGLSGYTTTPLRCSVGRWNESKQRWDDHAGDGFTDGGDPPMYWSELPQLP